MKCCVEGCERDAHYKAAQLCQMHYFRQRWYGTTETVKRGKAKPKPYEPKTHAKHERSNSVAITCNGKTLTAAEWVREPGVTVSRAGLIWRLRQGWETSRALFQQGRFA